MKIKERYGDKVRITIEGTLMKHEPGYNTGLLRIQDSSGVQFALIHKDADYIKEVEFTSTQFKIGDRVRYIHGGDYEFTLGKKGYFDHNNNIWFEYFPGQRLVDGVLAEFNTDNYIKVG